jgi:hypothetical protein
MLKRAGMPAFVALLAAGTLLGGCGKETEVPADAPAAAFNAVPKPASAPAPIADPPTPAPVEPTTPEDRIAAAADFVTLEAIQRDYVQGETKSPSIEAALAARWEALAAGMTPRTLVEGLELLGTQTRITGKTEYTFSVLFRPTVDIATDYHFSFDGFVHPDHVKLLEGKNNERGHIKLPRRMNDSPTSQWKKGGYYVVHTKAEVPLIPYNLRVLAFSPTEESFWNHVGQRLNLGWQWAVKDGSDFIRKVVACNTPAELYRLAPDGPLLKAPVQQAIDEKWKSLTQGATPQPLAEGLEFFSLETKATGDKEYTFSFLVRSTADLNTDYIFSVIGAVDPSHLQHIRPAKPGASHAAWNFELKHDPVSTWKKGRFHVAQLVIQSEIIPYNISVWVSPRGADGKWDWDKKGNRIKLGWQADIRK